MQDISSRGQQLFSQRYREGVSPVTDARLSQVRPVLVGHHPRQPGITVRQIERDRAVRLLRVPYPAGDAAAACLVDIALKEMVGRGRPILPINAARRVLRVRAREVRYLAAPSRRPLPGLAAFLARRGTRSRTLCPRYFR